MATDARTSLRDGRGVRVLVHSLPRPCERRHIALTLGAAHELLVHGPFAASLGAGYQTDWYFARDGQSERSTRHFLHGPMFAPGVSYSLSSSRYLPTARGGTLALELRAPTQLWFRAPGATGATVVGGFTFGCYGVF
jgi:hypothetical protein